MKHYILILVIFSTYSCRNKSLERRLYDLSGFWELVEYSYEDDLQLINGNFFLSSSGGINFPGRQDVYVVKQGEWNLVFNSPDSLVINVAYSDTVYCGNWIIKNIKYVSGNRDFPFANYLELHQGNKILIFNRGQK